MQCFIDLMTDFHKFKITLAKVDDEILGLIHVLSVTEYGAV